MKLGFSVLSQAWYGPDNLKRKDVVEEINFGLYAEEGGCKWEASFNWYKFRVNDELALKLSVFDDGFQLFKDHPKFVAELGELQDKNPTVETIINLLKKHGFSDRTERKSDSVASV